MPNIHNPEKAVRLWPIQAKTFQNLRSSRETELFKITNGNIKAVCQWIGNSPEVAMAHYAQITEADMKEAATKTVLKAAEKRVQDPVHTMAESSCTTLNEYCIESDVTSCEYNDLQQKNTGVQFSANCTPVGRAGFELKQQKLTQPSTNIEVKNQMSISPNLERVQNTVHNSNISAELEEIVANWDALPEYIRKAISTLIRSNAK